VTDNAFYTVILSNPDDILGDIGPIVHQFVVNILGSNFKDGDISNGDQIREYFPPWTPYITVNAHYSYLVLEQDAEITELDELREMPHREFPVEEVMKEYGLTLITSNYFVTELDVLAELSFSVII